MNDKEAIRICEGWLRYLDNQAKKSEKMQRLAAQARKGPEDAKKAQAELRRMDRDVTVCRRAFDKGTDMNDRIKLAEAMGWIPAAHPQDRKYQCWIDPNHNGRKVSDQQLPDPFTDANDCHALIKHLNGQHISVSVTQWASYGTLPSVNVAGKCGVRFDHNIGTHQEWTGDNYMQGVCELALEVLDNE